MSDLFHESTPVEYIQRIFAVMQEAKQHVFQVLTKRPERMVEFASELPWPENVWMGVTIESRRFVHRADCSARYRRRCGSSPLSPCWGRWRIST